MSFLQINEMAVATQIMQHNPRLEHAGRKVFGDPLTG
jgi:hypothetical protein